MKKWCLQQTIMSGSIKFNHLTSIRIKFLISKLKNSKIECKQEICRLTNLKFITKTGSQNTCRSSNIGNSTLLINVMIQLTMITIL